MTRRAVEGDEALVNLPGCCVHGRYGWWTGETKPPAIIHKRPVPTSYEIAFYMVEEGGWESLWLTEEQLVWL